MRRKSLSNINKPFIILPLLFVMCFVAGISLVAILLSYQNQRQANAEFNTFASCAELVEYVNVNYSKYYYPGRAGEDVASPSTGNDGSGTTGGSGTPSYSNTNVQVEGVDEADVIKTNGKYIFTISSADVTIVEPIDGQMSIVASIDSIPGTPRELFLNGNNLIVISDNYGGYSGGGARPLIDSSSLSYYGGGNQTSLSIFDVSNPAKPDLERSILFDGSYSTARMIEDNVYVIGNYYPYSAGLFLEENLQNVLPRIADVENRNAQEADLEVMADCTGISHYGNTGRTFTNVVAINLANPNSLGKKVLLGSAQSIYASASNLYLTAAVYPETTYVPCSGFNSLLGCTMPAPQPASTDISTAVFKLGLENTEVKFKSTGSVKGTLLNQFSMDEHSGYFRLATTNVNERGATVNNLYVLDESLKPYGQLEGLARSERIYSVRFMDDRAYMVTYRNVDPLFAISLTDPKNPTVLGELKIPGFSNYLHPYDEKFVIGFGRDTEARGDIAILKGLKVGLFDVSDTNAPKEISTYNVGGRYSSSALLDDHKALLFDRERNLIVMPATLYPDEIDKEYRADFSGFLVLSVSPEAGLKEKGRIGYEIDSLGGYYPYNKPRSLFIDNYLYTSINDVMKSNELDTLKLVGELGLK